MSLIPLSIIEEQIERSIFEAVREELVDKNMLPDITTFNLATGQNAWETALQVLKGSNTHGWVAELFGVSGYQTKNTKKVPRIVIDSQQFLPGELGGDTTRIYQQPVPGPNNPFNGLARPPRSADYYFNLHVVTNKTDQLRKLQALLAIALPRRGYIKFHFEAMPTFSGNLFIQQLAYTDYPQTEEGVMEKIYRYVITDVWEQECIVQLQTTGPQAGQPVVYAPIDEITITPEIDGNATDPLVVDNNP